MKLYKLTNESGCTHGNTQWKEGTTLKLKKLKNPRLCTGGVIHAYRNIELAFLLNPIHADFDNPIVWEADGEVCCEDWGKVGCFELTTIKKLSNPKWVGTKNEIKVKAAFAILCAESVIHLFKKRFPKDNRCQEAILAARQYLKNPSYSVAKAATTADAAHAGYAADAAAAADAAYAAYAAYAVADAAYAAHTAADAADAYAVADAAYAAHTAADAAGYAADAAAAAHDTIDFVLLANQAVKMIMGEKKSKPIEDTDRKE